MSRRDDRVSLVDMLIHAREAVAMSSQRSLKHLQSDRVFQLAMQKLVEIVGEAVQIGFPRIHSKVTRASLGLRSSERATA